MNSLITPITHTAYGEDVATARRLPVYTRVPGGPDEAKLTAKSGNRPPATGAHGVKQPMSFPQALGSTLTGREPTLRRVSTLRRCHSCPRRGDVRDGVLPGNCCRRPTGRATMRRPQIRNDYHYQEQHFLGDEARCYVCAETVAGGTLRRAEHVPRQQDEKLAKR